MKKVPLLHVEDSPEQVRIKRALYHMPFMGGSNFTYPEPGQMSWGDVAYNLEIIQARLESLAKDHQVMTKSIQENDQIFAALRGFMGRIMPLVTAPEKDFDTQIRELLVSKGIIDAIKFVRAQKGWGLKESKDYVDTLRGWSPR
jgi:ribosomal protein L7/L12